MEDVSPWKELWNPGEVAHFEYHCYEGHDSADAELWYRSHQQVTVLGEADHDGHGLTYEERMDAGAPKMYRIRFADNFEGEAFEDELMENTSGFCRPDPPRKGA